jgi:hypothetical protein
MARGASNGAGEAAYLIRNKYSCHISGAGWCQVFDCYPTPHVRERPSEPGTYLPRVSKKFETISNGFFHPSGNPFSFRTSIGDLLRDVETKIIRSRCRGAPLSGRTGHIFKVHSRELVFHVNIYSKVTVCLPPSAMQNANPTLKLKSVGWRACQAIIADRRHNIALKSIADRYPLRFSDNVSFRELWHIQNFDRTNTHFVAAKSPIDLTSVFL